MKICILATGYPRTKEDIFNTYLHALAQALQKKGIDVHILVPHEKGLKKEEVRDSIYIHRFQYMFPASFQSLAYFPGMPEKLKSITGRIQMPFFLFWMYFALIKVIQQNNIDIINAHWAIPPGVISIISKPIHKKPSLITLYGAELFPAIHTNSKILKWIINIAINRAEKVIAISDITCQAGMRISGNKNIEIVPDGIDVDKFYPYHDKFMLKKKYHFENDFVIITSGRMVERKGFKYLIEAIPLILIKIPNVKVIIGGKGPEEKNLKLLTATLGVSDYIIFPGFISDGDYPDLMRMADIFVLPSIVDKRGDTEGSATILLEAMACGTPVIGTNVGGVPYTIKEGIGGYLVPPKNPPQLAEKIIELLHDKSLRENLGKVGSQYVSENYSFHRIAEKYLKIFEKLNE